MTTINVGWWGAGATRSRPAVIAVRHEKHFSLRGATKILVSFLAATKSLFIAGVNDGVLGVVDKTRGSTLLLNEMSLDVSGHCMMRP